MIEEFETVLATQEVPTIDRGIVDLIVIRLGNEAHGCPQTVALSAASGIAGDRWNLNKDPSRASQVTLMMTSVAKTVAGNKPLHLPGDNFLVSLDLSESALVVGTRLRLGTALLEVSEKSHTGCAKFSKRFGSAALRWINKADHRDRRLRGVNCKILEDGRVSLGDLIERVSRAS